MFICDFNYVNQQKKAQQILEYKYVQLVIFDKSLLLLISFILASHLLFNKEFSSTVLEYGPVILAFKLEQMNIINSRQYEQLFNLNVSDKYKSLVLSSFTLSQFILSKYLECINVFNSDRKLWHLSIRIRQRS